MKETIMVNTPSGKCVYHGDVIDRTFCRKFDYEKDIMHIFNALSIHPDAIKKIKDLGVDTLQYEEIDTHKVYTISLKSAIENGFEKNFSGGLTRYIPLKFWSIKDKNQPNLL